MLPGELLFPPNSTFFTVGLAFLISLTTTMLNRKFINKEQRAKWQKEISRWNAEKERAKKTGDKKLMAQVKKQEPMILQIEKKMFSQSMKTFAVTFVPILVIWQILTRFYMATPVAFFIPIFSGGPLELPFYIWYLICSFFVSTILSRIFGMEGAGMGMGMGMPLKTEEEATR